MTILNVNCVNSNGDRFSLTKTKISVKEKRGWQVWILGTKFQSFARTAMFLTPKLFSPAFSSKCMLSVI